MAGDEIKVIHKDKTSGEIALDELAKTRASCLCRRQYGRCTKAMCQKCVTRQQLNNCMNQLSDYDMLRLDNKTAEFHCEMSAIPNMWKPYKRVKAENNRLYIILFGIPIGFLALLYLLVILASVSVELFAESPSGVKGYSYIGPRSQIENQITETVAEVKRTLRDVTGDGEVNCQDAAIMFKTYWDSWYPDKKAWCTLVSNYKPGVMNHLFVRITTDEWQSYWVEPRAPQTEAWDMKYVWGDAYDGRYNVYERTEYWMRRKVR